MKVKSETNEVQNFLRKILNFKLSWEQPVPLGVYGTQAVEVFVVQVDGEVLSFECEVHTRYHRCGSMEEEVWT